MVWGESTLQNQHSMILTLVPKGPSLRERFPAVARGLSDSLPAGPRILGWMAASFVRRDSSIDGGQIQWKN